MSFDDPCPHCGASMDQHDYEHFARSCYPAQIERLDAEIERLRAALQQIADIGEGSKTINSLSHIAKIARTAARG